MRNNKEKCHVSTKKTIFLEKRCDVIRRSFYNNEHWLVEDYWTGKGKSEQKNSQNVFL